MHPAACPGVVRDEIGIRRVNVYAVSCRSPEHTTRRGPLRNAALPDDLAAGIRIEAKDDTRLVADHDQLTAATDVDEKRRAGKIEVGRVLVRAYRGFAIGCATAPVPDVVLGDLTRPA